LKTIDNSEQSVLVIGMGVTGVSCARYFAARGIAVQFADSREQPPGLDEVRQLCPQAEIFAGALPEELPSGVVQVVVSPGVRVPEALLAQARSNSVSVVSDIDLYLMEEMSSVLLVTGSNGKSTVTSLVNHILNAAGRQSVAGGNLGIAALDLLDEPHDVAVLELSSFQLERSQPPHSAVAAVLNLAVDHIDQHGSFTAYRDAKARIYENCELALVNRDEPELAAMVPAGKPTISFGIGQPREGEWGVAGGQVMFGNEPVMPVSGIPLVGRHNLANVLAACAIAQASGVPRSVMAAAVSSFAALEHRMQLVPTDDGIVWINDSKATNEAAAAASVDSVSDPLILIAGGDGKGSDFAMLAEALLGRDACALIYGQDAVEIQAVLAPVCAVSRVADLEAAVKDAGAIAKPGCTVLLAPACSSLDMFRNFAERGERFVAAVNSLGGGSGS